MMMIMIIKLTSLPWLYSHDYDDDNKIDFYTLAIFMMMMMMMIIKLTSTP